MFGYPTYYTLQIIWRKSVNNLWHTARLGLRPLASPERLLQFSAGEMLKHLRFCGWLQDVVGGKIVGLRIARFSDTLSRHRKIIVRVPKLDVRPE